MWFHRENWEWRPEAKQLGSMLYPKSRLDLVINYGSSNKALETTLCTTVNSGMTEPLLECVLICMFLVLQDYMENSVANASADNSQISVETYNNINPRIYLVCDNFYTALF